jgi:hypothetical protein
VKAVWLAIVLLACDLLTWSQTLSLSGPLRVAEPKTLRLRLLAIAGRLTRPGGEPSYGWTGAGPELPRSPPPPWRRCALPHPG